jgi:hypothetical protein
MTDEPPKINGLIVSAALSWLRSTYGNDLVERAFLRLSIEERTPLKKLVVSIGWYDFILFENFLDACYQEVQKKTGESREQFDQKGVEEGGGSIMNSVYRFIFAMMQPSNVLNRMITLFKRNYTHGNITILENRHGYCLIKSEIPKDMYRYMIRQNTVGYNHILKLSGAQNIKISNTESPTENGHQLNTELIYQ